MNLTIMLKSVLTSLLICCSLVAGSNTTESKGEGFSLPSPTPVSKAISINLDTNELTLPCPPGHQGCGNGPSPDLVIDVNVGSVNSRKQSNYRYTVSGGRVIGQGPSVKWDLSGVFPGTYRITVEEKKGRRMLSATETAFVFEDICICDYECPMISVDSSKLIASPQEIIRFTADVSGGSFDGLEFSWTLSAGEIVAGQGTPEISVKVPASNHNSKVTATLEVKGIKPESGCPTTSDRSIKIKP